MIRHMQTERDIQQARHRVLCGIIGATEAGQNLLERARRLGFPVDWQDVRVYPNRPGYSDYGATFMLAKDVARAEAAREIRLRGETPDKTTIEAASSRAAQIEATSIFNALRENEIELSGYSDGRYFTCQQSMPWNRQHGLEILPPHSKRH